MSEKKQTEESEKKKPAANTFHSILHHSEPKSDEQEARDQDVTPV
jgi:hypothetical protein